MNRKNFLSSIIPAAATLSSFGAYDKTPAATFHQQIPPYLQKGDVIGITCPAGFITPAEIEPAMQKIKEWGFEIKAGSTVGKKDFTYGGTDEERLQDFQEMMDDKKVKAILCARGGYGMVRIIDRLDFKNFVAHPKWIIGFSDITVMHSHLNRNFGIASIHSKMSNSFPDDWYKAEQVQRDSIDSIRDCLLGPAMKYSFAPHIKNRPGISSGVLVGGNLKTLESLAGSKSDIITKNKILFVEDTGEYLYSIDRMFWNLKRSGKLSNLKGLIIGGFRIKKDDEGEAFGKTLDEIVMEKISEYSYPVCFEFPVGHQKYNLALKCGVTHQLTVQPNACSLNELI